MTLLAPDPKLGTGHAVGYDVAPAFQGQCRASREEVPEPYRDITGICLAGSKLRGVGKRGCSRRSTEQEAGDCWVDKRWKTEVGAPWHTVGKAPWK